uniref:Uncharacterized protein n=1 Tax=Bionectria ochroleuca TaxID=29856 RepID=A0A8H7NNA9_BIOOC
MYLAITPNPFRNDDERDRIFDVKGQPVLYQKIGDGRESRVEGYRTENPNFAAAVSHGQLPILKDGNENVIRHRPGKEEEKSTYKENEYQEGSLPKKGDIEFRKYTARTQAELDERKIKNKPWTHEEMEKNAREKLKHIKNHKAGDKTSEWYKLEMESQKMCNIKNIKSADSYVFDGGMPLENDADSVVLPSDDQNPAGEDSAGEDSAGEDSAGEGPAGEDSGDEKWEDSNPDDESWNDSGDSSYYPSSN